MTSWCIHTFSCFWRSRFLQTVESNTPGIYTLIQEWSRLICFGCGGLHPLWHLSGFYFSLVGAIPWGQTVGKKTSPFSFSTSHITITCKLWWIVSQMSYYVTDIAADLCDTWEKNFLPSVHCCFPLFALLHPAVGSPQQTLGKYINFLVKKKKKNRIHENVVILVLNKLLYNSLDISLMHL